MGSKQSSTLLVEPWRKFPDEDGEWTPEYRDKLQELIPTLQIADKKSFSIGKIVMMGSIRSGKSSFINSIASVQKGRIVQYAFEGEAAGSLTDRFNQFQCGNYTICDTMGVEDRDGLGFNMNDFHYLLKGNIPSSHRFDSAHPVTEQSEGFIKQPKNADRVHCIIFCIDCQHFLTNERPSYIDRLHDLHIELQRLNIPRILLLTKIDKFCDEVNGDILKTYSSKSVDEAVKRASELFKLPEMYIHPIKNFTNESTPEFKQAILLLIALRRALEFCQDYTEKLITVLVEPWRKFPDEDGEWTPEYRDKLQELIPTLRFADEKSVSIGKIVMMGPIRSGKSSFINSISSVQKGRMVQKASVGEAAGSLTDSFNQFQFGNFTIYDKMGVEDRDGLGFNMADFNYLLKGNIPSSYKFDSAHPVTEQTEGFIKHPKNADRVHCTIFCIDGQHFLSNEPPSYIGRLQELHIELQCLHIPRILLLTKIDKFCDEVHGDISNTYNSKSVARAVKRASEMFKLPEMYIHPIKNYTTESTPEFKQAILLLIALRRALEFSQDYVEELPSDDSHDA